MKPRFIVQALSAPVPLTVAGLTMQQLIPGTVYPTYGADNTPGRRRANIDIAIGLTDAADRIEYRIRDAVTQGNPVLRDWSVVAYNVPAGTTSIRCNNVPENARRYFIDLRANSDNAQIVLGTSAIKVGTAGTGSNQPGTNDILLYLALGLL